MSYATNRPANIPERFTIKAVPGQNNTIMGPHNVPIAYDVTDYYAPLLAATPNMLEALHWVHDAFQISEVRIALRQQTSSATADKMFDMVDDAIAKAAGKGLSLQPIDILGKV